MRRSRSKQLTSTGDLENFDDTYMLASPRAIAIVDLYPATRLVKLEISLPIQLSLNQSRTLVRGSFVCDEHLLIMAANSSQALPQCRRGNFRDDRSTTVNGLLEGFKHVCECCELILEILNISSMILEAANQLNECFA